MFGPTTTQTTEVRFPFPTTTTVAGDQDGQESQPLPDEVVQSTTTVVVVPATFTTTIVFPFPTPFSDELRDEAAVDDLPSLVGNFQPTTVVPRPLTGGTPSAPPVAVAVVDPGLASPLPTGVVSTSTVVRSTTTTSGGAAGDTGGRGGERAAPSPDVDAADDTRGGSAPLWPTVLLVLCAVLVGGPIAAHRVRHGPD